MRNADLGMRNELGSKGAREYESPRVGPLFGLRIWRGGNTEVQRSTVQDRESILTATVSIDELGPSVLAFQRGRQ